MMNNMMSFYAKISIFDFYESHIIVYFTVQINYKFQEPGRPHLTKKPIEFKIVYYHLHSLFAVSCILTYKAWFPEHISNISCISSHDININYEKKIIPHYLSCMYKMYNYWAITQIATAGRFLFQLFWNILYFNRQNFCNHYFCVYKIFNALWQHCIMRNCITCVFVSIIKWHIFIITRKLNSNKDVKVCN